MKLPTFLIIGVQKAGTTSIYDYLQAHPQVYMSPIKEINFFQVDWDNADEETKAKKPNGINSWEKYCQLFADARDELALGEASPNYLFKYQDSAENIHRYLPDVKTIAILRDPVERAYSDYLMHVRDVIGKPKSLVEQAQQVPITSFTIRKGFYYEQLKYFFDKFNREQIRVYLYDELVKNPVEMMQDMYRFIGVDDTFVPDTSSKKQVAQVPKSTTVNQLLRGQNWFRSVVSSALKPIIPLEVRQKIRSKLIKMNSAEKKAMPLLPAERQILRELYREDILKLQDLIQKDLSKWLD
ncbi:sulfotransferase family protein [Oscillatoria salina]|uniref:sulfotransferase family protein n=1 Tax=Oscillatoria salina TaxID=331517 RepID=UPI0013B65C9B|nr:sulfotransferase [Oscillatoria salina]MBZ8179809.1 sulfotransferase [Oscillatoria salina IIICB1]NET87680.1 sulfotransferase [Kamptonema sp. SIO1D9]